MNADTFTPSQRRIVNNAHRIIWDYLEVGEHREAEQTARKLAGIIKAFSKHKQRRKYTS